ncbi:unnamed protein product [Peronospora destructor]|uniref:Reverse transcriptase domain-containing protein n=1 Tax=Peronospora destructor TaxID=86335 RepID=A0AAV0T6D3_9STRA|nr:unnamed protein product [Peronospora destructor]
MRYFGFADSFITTIRHLHQDTTARFVVNGILSDPIPVLTGIRQGGADTGGDAVRRFGELSGLSVRPAKSVLIFLNAAVVISDYEGIPVLRHGQTTRYLGYQVGTGDLVDANWALRIRNVRKRLATAASLSTSVAIRILLLNAIMLPAVLFTAAVFRLLQWARAELHNIQKQFLWHHSTSTSSSRHKVNPGLMYTPRGAGGIGLVSMDVAICTQNLKNAIKWLIQKRDRYFYAWAAWIFQDMEDSANWSISPGLPKTGRNSSSAAPQPEIRAAISEWIAPTHEEWTIVKQHREESWKRLVTHLVATRSNQELLLQYVEDIPTLTDMYTQESTRIFG